MIVKKCKHLQKVKKAKCKIIVEFQSDTDEEDDEIVEKINKEKDEEENTDENKEEPIHFKKERQNLQQST